MKKTLFILLALTLLFALAACSSAVPTDRLAAIESSLQTISARLTELTEAASAASTPAETEPVPDAEPAPDSTPLRVMVLNGTTGFGAAEMMHAASAGETALSACTFSVETDASAVTAALVNGTADIAALPTNAAASLYAKTGGGVQLLALNTRGVLYLVVNGETRSVSSLSDLEGMTVYAPAQNPSILFAALCEAAGVSVTVDTSYAQPADLRTALAAGAVDIAVLPEPMVTLALAANDALTVALDLTEAWDSVFTPGSLVQGCLVVRAQYAAEHPDTVNAFLSRYGKSVAFLTEDPAAAAEYIVEAGLFSAAPAAEAAIPRCNTCFLTGDDMRSAMEGFLSVLLTAAPDSVGGALPDTDFYYYAD